MSRPLVGEPLALDLVNTQWVDHARPHDLFDDPAGLRDWLQEHELGDARAPVEAALRHARATLRRVLEEPGPPAEQELNAVLSRGTIRHALHDGDVDEVVDVDPAWSPAWHAARNYLDLLRQNPTRIRRCAHPACVLYFFDTSRNGTRRWCSMDGCGARAKAARHYRRQRETTD